MTFVMRLTRAMIFAASLPVAFAEEIVITYPQGWSASGDVFVPHSTAESNCAVVAYQFQSDPHHNFDKSLIIQRRASSQLVTSEFDGKVFDIAYSPSGSYLLAHRVDGDLDSGAIGAHLLGSQGEVLMSTASSDGRMLFFSTTGQVLYAWNPGSAGSLEGGKTIEIFDLSGHSVRLFTLHDDNIRGATVIGDGSRAVFFTTRSIVALNASGTLPAWRIDLPAEIPDIMNTRQLDESRVVASLRRSAQIVVNLSGEGAIEYVFDPQALGDADPLMSPQEYATFRMSAAAQSENQIVLFRGREAGKTVDLVVGAMSDKGIDTALPSRNHKMGEIQGRYLFFFSTADVHIRPIS